MRRVLIAGALVGALTVAGGGSALAAHDHDLVTPGTCVEDIASGQTSQTSGDGAHQFHDNVHLGTPGMEAFTNLANPVSVYKAGTGPGC